MTDSRLSRRRQIMRRTMRSLQSLFSRAEVTGLENIPDNGPLLILFNHLSILDGPLFIANVPHEIELVGPGDFPMTALEQKVIAAYGITLINRGRADRSSLRAMTDHLKAGRMLALAPDGGTWEKRLWEVKDGAAYVSQLTQTPMLPVALGGLYNVPVFDIGKLARRPRISIRFGQVMPPVPPSLNRSDRHEDLRRASEAIMQRIHEMLPPEDQARYDHWGRATYDVRLSFEALDDGHPMPYDGPPLPDMAALGEFLAKPSLFRPMWVNAGLLVEPFRERRYFAPLEVKLAVRDLMKTLTSGAFDVYLDYRLGEEKAKSALIALAALGRVSDWAAVHHARMRIAPVVKDCINPV